MSARNGFLLDTNVISETRRSLADARVLAFLATLDSSAIYLSVLTIGELHKGLTMLRRRDPEAATRIGVWVEGIEITFADRLLAVDARVARLWGTLSADRGRSVIDTLLAATAIVHDLALVTRNTRDVQNLAVTVIDPWTTSG